MRDSATEVKSKTVIVAGGRDFQDYKKAKSFLDKVLANILPDVVVVSGGAFGADRLGERYALEYDLPVKLFDAPWDDVDNKPIDEIGQRRDGSLYWKAAGSVRNQDMAEYADLLVAFWDGKSRGTKDMIQRMVDANKPLRICRYDNRSK